MTILKEIDFQVPSWGELQQPPSQRLSYSAEVLADSPLMYLRLDEASGSSAYDQMGNHPAAVEGTVQWGVAGPMSYFGQTGMAAGGTGGLIVQETGWLPLGHAARTFELWYRPSASASAFLGINYGQASAGGLLMWSCTASELSVYVSNCLFGVRGLTLAGGWHHIALVFPAGATRCDEFILYLDAEPLNATVLSGSGGTLINTQDSALRINPLAGGYANDCDYAEVAVYATALSAQRIREHYTAGALVGA